MEDNKITTVSLVVIVIFIVGVVLRLAKPVLFPFFLAIFLSFILYPALDFLTRIKIPRIISIIFILLFTFFILYLLGTLFYSTGKAFAAEFPKYGEKMNEILTSLFERLNLPQFKIETSDWAGELNLDRIGKILGSSLGPFFSFLSNLFLVLIFLVFILAGRGRVKQKIQKYLDKKRAEKANSVIVNIDRQVQRYLVIKTIVSFFTGVFALVVLLFFGVDFAIIFGFLTFLLNYIPNIGSFIATALPFTIAVFQFETIWPAFWILVLLTTIQLIMANIIEPRLMGHGLGLSPLVVLFFLFFWGWLWGLPGMILAVPIAAIIKIVFNNIPGMQFIAAFMSKE
ncbi:MAG: AI-2E family transporter [Candidatus Aminicenantes bacterium]|nr:AI-2E family transporter [Candidatus Aminicenantes bacterium]